VTDNGEGSYTIPVAWEPAIGGPGLVVSQPDRALVPIGPPATVPPPVVVPMVVPVAHGVPSSW